MSNVPITVLEALEAVKDWEPDNKPLDKGYDPYNSADAQWSQWLLCLAYGQLG
jgi:hypothetical protein